MSDITRYVPNFLKNSSIFSTIYDAEIFELNDVENATTDVLDQCFVDTATWGLKYWEAFLGLDTDLTKPDAFRRERITAKLRGYGTVTRQFIQNVASAFSNGEVDVIEHPSEYKFTVKFVGTKGIPPNMADLSKTLDEIKPAHLTYEYSYTYNVWDFLSGMTWETLTPHTWDEIRVI